MGLSGMRKATVVRAQEGWPANVPSFSSVHIASRAEYADAPGHLGIRQASQAETLRGQSGRWPAPGSLSRSPVSELSNWDLKE